MEGTITVTSLENVFYPLRRGFYFVKNGKDPQETKLSISKKTLKIVAKKGKEEERILIETYYILTRDINFSIRNSS